MSEDPKENADLSLALGKETANTEKVERGIIEFFNIHGIGYLKTSAREEGDLDYTVKSDIRFNDKDVDEIRQIFSDDEVNYFKVYGKEVGEEVKISKAKTKYSPFSVYVSAGILVINVGGLQVDVISGYSLAALVDEWEKETGLSSHVFSIKEIGRGKDELRVHHAVPRVDFSLAIGRQEFSEQINGINNLCSSLKVLKSFLEFDYFRNLSEKEKQRVHFNVDDRVQKIESNMWGNIKKYSAIKGGRWLNDILGEVRDFLDVQTSVGNMNQNQADSLTLRLRTELLKDLVRPEIRERIIE